MQHSVQVQVKREPRQGESVLRSLNRRLPQRLLRWLLGESADVLVLVPGQSVESIVIRQHGETERGERDETV